MTTTYELPKTQDTHTTNYQRKQHLVEKRKGDEGRGDNELDYQDETLCGKPYDMLMVKVKGPMCKDCLDEMKRRLCS